MQTPQWVKKLGGHAGELYVAAELSKRAIPNSLLPENFSDDGIIIGGKDGKQMGYIQVKSCHPDRSTTFRLSKENARWVNAKDNEFIVFVWLGSARKSGSPIYWIAPKKEVGYLCKKEAEINTQNNDCRFAPDEESNLSPKWNYRRIEKRWRNNWQLLKNYSVW